MSIRLYADEFRCAIYEEAPGGGDPIDPTSQMNRPVVSPSDWLGQVYFHSDFDYYSTQFFANVTISHAAFSGGVSASGPIIANYGRANTATHLLVQHDYGVVPRFFLIYDGKMIPHGTPIQYPALSAARYVTGYSTTTQVRLFERMLAGTSNLPALSIDYQVMVFRPSAADPLLDQLLLTPADVVFGQGKFRMEWPHLRVVGAGESPFAQALGPTAAVGNGGIRIYQPDNNTPINFGGYSGSFGPPAFVNLEVGKRS